MQTLRVAFVHRTRDDGSVDSICRTCFRTIAIKETIADLAEEEIRHECQGFDLVYSLRPTGKSNLPKAS